MVLQRYAVGTGDFAEITAELLLRLRFVFLRHGEVWEDLGLQ